jgi:drug/metabolite transporter (DMT)-like permease
LVGWSVAIVAWGLHVGALSLAPLSIVQAVLSGGLVFLAVFAERFFGFHLDRRQRVGVTITAAGLVVIGLTGGGANEPQRASLAALIAVEGTIFAIGAALVRVSTRRHVLPRAEGCSSARPPARSSASPMSRSNGSPRRRRARCSGC